MYLQNLFHPCPTSEDITRQIELSVIFPQMMLPLHNISANNYLLFFWILFFFSLFICLLISVYFCRFLILNFFFDSSNFVFYFSRFNLVCPSIQGDPWRRRLDRFKKVCFFIFRITCNCRFLFFLCPSLKRP